MKRLMSLFKKFSRKVMSLAKKIFLFFRHVFKKGNMTLWILDGLVIILIIFIAIDVFHKVQRPEIAQYYPSPAVSPEIPSESPGGAEVGISVGEQIESEGWKTLASFGGVGSGTNSVNVAPKIRWRIALTTKTTSRETSVLKFLVYHKGYPQEPVENFTKELEYRGDGGGKSRDIIEICDTTGGDYIIDIGSTNFEWNAQVEISKD